MGAGNGSLINARHLSDSQRQLEKGGTGKKKTPRREELYLPGRGKIRSQIKERTL